MDTEEAEKIRSEMRAYIAQKLGGTQYRLADLLGCDRVNLSKFLNGHTATMRKGVIQKFQGLRDDSGMGRAGLRHANNLGTDIAKEQITDYANNSWATQISELKELISYLENPEIEHSVKVSLFDKTIRFYASIIERTRAAILEEVDKQ